MNNKEFYRDDSIIIKTTADLKEFDVIAKDVEGHQFIIEKKISLNEYSCKLNTNSSEEFVTDKFFEKEEDWILIFNLLGEEREVPLSGLINLSEYSRSIKEFKVEIK